MSFEIPTARLLWKRGGLALVAVFAATACGDELLPTPSGVADAARPRDGGGRQDSGGPGAPTADAKVPSSRNDAAPSTEPDTATPPASEAGMHTSDSSVALPGDRDAGVPPWTPGTMDGGRDAGGCDLVVQWQELSWPTETCTSFSTATLEAQAHWDGTTLTLGDSISYESTEGGFASAYYCAYGTELQGWRAFETVIPLDLGADPCDGQPHTAEYHYQECQESPLTSLCISAENSCKVSGQVVFVANPRAESSTGEERRVVPSDMAACFQDNLPKSENEPCTSAYDCGPDHYCNTSGDKECFSGVCTQAPTYLSCSSQAPAPVCDCSGEPVPDFIANKCEAMALGVTPGACNSSD